MTAHTYITPPPVSEWAALVREDAARWIARGDGTCPYEYADECDVVTHHRDMHIWACDPAHTEALDAAAREVFGVPFDALDGERDILTAIYQARDDIRVAEFAHALIDELWGVAR